jgi:ATP-dependent DNA helicase RecQ
MLDLRQQLQELFGLDEFRLSQREVIEDVLAGKDVLCVMPTGAGKSLCYQLPAAVQGGLTIVVSPLISLMEDQVQQLRDEGLSAALLNSSLTPAMQRETIAQIEAGFEGLLYVAPERFFAPNFQPLLPKLNVKLLAIDEAHCISQWGHDFRPEYLQLGQVRKQLGMPPTIALTATATDDVRADIIHGLALRDPSVVVTGFDRPNLSYQSRRTPKVREKEMELIHLLRNEPGSAIVYCATRKAVDELTSMLRDELRDRSVYGYHAGLDQTTRTQNQEAFMQTPKAIAIATNAFGMGINKPDIRLVVHYNLPGTLEAYYQEAGRAGRDGLPARCVVLFSYQDRYTQEFFIDKIGEDRDGADPQVIEKLKDRAREKLDLVIRYAQTHRCRRQMILDYFGDEAEISGCRCDVCVASSPGSNGDATAEPVAVVIPDEVTLLVRQLLSGIARLRGQFGVGTVAEVLIGSDGERMWKWGLDKLSVYGLLRAHSSKRVVAMLHRVMEAGLARQRDPDGVKFRPVVELTAAGIAVMKGEQPPPASLIDLAPGRGSRASGTNPRAMGTNPRALGSNPKAIRERSQPEPEDDYQPDPQAIQRFERLRAIRAQIAREKDLPAYCICHDSTLKLIARFAPDSLQKLEQIKGMGPHKVRAYGQQLLEAIKEANA